MPPPVLMFPSTGAPHCRGIRLHADQGTPVNTLRQLRTSRSFLDRLVDQHQRLDQKGQIDRPQPPEAADCDLGLYAITAVVAARRNAPGADGQRSGGIANEARLSDSTRHARDGCAASFCVAGHRS